MAAGARRTRRHIDVWPGYVDALAALLILVIFVLLLFSFAQFLLSQILSSQETELDVMYERVVELTDLLGLEQERSARLSGEVAGLSARVGALTEDNAALNAEVASLGERNAEQQQQLSQQLLLVASLQEDIDALRRLRDRLETEVGSLASQLEDTAMALGRERDRSQALEARLAEQTERTVLAQRQLADQEIRIQALTAVVVNREEALERQRSLSAESQAEVALLILRGHSSVSIGLRLGISPQTVKVFRKQLYRKCGISSQAELFALLVPLLGPPGTAPVKRKMG